jgi:DNA-binding response OmpR family regulator
MGEALAPVLLVEDDPEVHRLMRICLEQAGYQVKSAYSGEDALEILRSTTPSVILLDNQLPGMDGFRTCRQIRELFDLPIIMVTVMDQTDEKLLGLEVGADMYLSKPFLPDELVARVGAAWRRYYDWEVALEAN